MENKHDGHRQRLRNRALETDMLGLKPHEVLELLLYPVVPRQNLNPLAHDILAHFGTLKWVFGASAEELQEVPGVTAQMAEWLVRVGNAVEAYIESHRAEMQFKNYRELVQYLRRLFVGSERECCWLLCLNSAGSVLRMHPIGRMDDLFSAEARRQVVGEAIHCHADVVILAFYREQLAFTAEEQRHLELLEAVLDRMDIMRAEFVVVNERSTKRKQRTEINKGMERALASEEEFSLKWLDPEDGEEI